MEMPIQIIVTMFIVVVVGVLVILFSQTILEGSEKRILDIGEEEKENTMLEVGSFDNTQLLNLIEQCFSENFGKTIEEKTCFFVHSDNRFDLSSADIFPLTNLDEDGRLEVENVTNIKSAIVKWNAREAKVEVSS